MALTHCAGPATQPEAPVAALPTAVAKHPPARPRMIEYGQFMARKVANDPKSRQAAKNVFQDQIVYVGTGWSGCDGATL